jgi:hypothetical protein
MGNKLHGVGFGKGYGSFLGLALIWVAKAQNVRVFGKLSAVSVFVSAPARLSPIPF